jgi:hypothetical protein
MRTRHRHRLALVASFSILGAGLTVAACSGDDGNTAGLFDAGTDVANGDATSGEDGGGTQDTGSAQDTSTADVIKTEASTRDTGVPNVVDGGPDSGGVPCIVGGNLETEPNNDPGTANTLSGTVCGTITPAALDLTDYYKFTLQPATTTMTLFFSGNVKITITVKGQTVVLTPQSSPAVPFEQGKEYSVKVESNEAVPTNRQNYTITLEEK